MPEGRRKIIYKKTHTVESSEEELRISTSDSFLGRLFSEEEEDE